MPLLIDSLKNKEVDWKKPVQVISKIVGKNCDKTIMDIEKHRKNEKVVKIELKALKIEN
jgi:hypothetical protein